MDLGTGIVVAWTKNLRGSFRPFFPCILMPASYLGGKMGKNWKERDKKLKAKKAKIKKHGYGLKVRFAAEHGIQKPPEPSLDKTKDEE